MLADFEVEQRFQKLVATLNSQLRRADGARVGEPVEQPASDDESPYEQPAGLGAARLLAAVTALAVLAAGIVVSRTADNGLLILVLWVAFVVPAATLGVVIAVGRLRR